MKRQKIIIEGLKAVSINSAYYSNKKFGYKSEVKDWIAQVCHQLGNDSNRAAIKNIRENFDFKKHSYTVLIRYHTPKFYNLQGYISHSSMDVENICKTLLDVLFTPAFHGNGHGLCENLNSDDCFISSLMVKKQPADDYKFEIEISIVDLPKGPKRKI